MKKFSSTYGCFSELFVPIFVLEPEWDEILLVRKGLMRNFYYGCLLSIALSTALGLGCKKQKSEVLNEDFPVEQLPEVVDFPEDDWQLMPAAYSRFADSIDTRLAEVNIEVSESFFINDPDRGGKFYYRPKSSGLTVDNGIVFAAGNGGFWEREVGDTVNLAWYNVTVDNPDNASAIKKGIQAAIKRKKNFVKFPSAGNYVIKSGNYWTIPDNYSLSIEGKGATIEVDKAAASKAQETYVMAFKCTETANSTDNKITIRNLRIKAPDIETKWIESNFRNQKLVMAIETDGVHTVEIKRCRLNDIWGYGIRLKNFVKANIDDVIERNVGGHFPIENEYDSFGDGIWLGHYDVETKRHSRKNSYAQINNCIIQGYETAKNGNFASRSGITVEGFASHGKDISMQVDVSNTTISDYDRNIHVEGIGSKINLKNCKIRNFYGLALVVSSPKTSITYNNCSASGLLPRNPKQERLALGGAVQFGSDFDLYLTGKSIFTFNGPATFRADFHIDDESILDFGNSDVFFDHSNLFLKSTGSMINIPKSVKRGFNMYGGSVLFEGGRVSATKAGSGVFKGERMSVAKVTKCRLENMHLFFAGNFGTLSVK